MKEFWSTFFNAMKHAFDIQSIDNFLGYIQNFLNEFGDLAEKFYALLP